MEIKYRNLLKEYEISNLDAEELDPGFVTKAKDFEKKFKAGSLSDEEVSQLDAELVTLFNDLHDFEEVDTDEVASLKRQYATTAAKEAANKAETIDQLKTIQQENKDIEEVVKFCQDKISQIEAKQKKQTEAEKRISELKAEIDKATSVQRLKAIADENADNKEIVDYAKAKAVQLQEGETQQKKQSVFDKGFLDYNDIRSLGLEPGASALKYQGITLRKRTFFKIYEVVK